VDGGTPPLGYDPDGRTLAINPRDASTVRHIYRRFLALGSVHRLAQELEESGIRSKTRQTASGTEVNGSIFSRGALLYILKNRVYLGETVHRGHCYPGQHPALMDPSLFNAMGELLRQNAIGRRERTLTLSPLTGLLFDAEGARMSPEHALNKYGQRYRYYSSKAPSRSAAVLPRKRRKVPAEPFEQLVLERLRAFASKPDWGWAAFRPSVRKIVLHRMTANILVAADAHGCPRAA